MAIAVPAAVLTGVMAVVAVPLAVGALGFGAGGILAGSAAASMMSTAWTTGKSIFCLSLKLNEICDPLTTEDYPCVS